jgi:hypothetical protein
MQATAASRDEADACPTPPALTEAARRPARSTRPCAAALAALSAVARLCQTHRAQIATLPADTAGKCPPPVASRDRKLSTHARQLRPTQTRPPAGVRGRTPPRAGSGLRVSGPAAPWLAPAPPRSAAAAHMT